MSGSFEDAANQLYQWYHNSAAGRMSPNNTSTVSHQNPGSYGPYTPQGYYGKLPQGSTPQQQQAASVAQRMNNAARTGNPYGGGPGNGGWTPQAQQASAGGLFGFNNAGSFQAGGLQTGARGGGVSSLSPQAAAARNNASNFIALAQSNPQEAQRLADMGMAPTINGVYGGDWVQDRRSTGGQSLPPGVHIATTNGPHGVRAGMPVTQVGGIMRPYQGSLAPAGGGQGSQSGTVPLAQQQYQQMQQQAPPVVNQQKAGATGGFRLGGLNLGLPGGQPQGAPQGGGQGGSLTGFMSQPGYTTPSVAQANPYDEASMIRAQEADRNAALQQLFSLQQGIGNSALARGIESQGAALASNPESFSAQDRQDAEARMIDENRTRAAEAQRAMAEQLGGTGRLGSGGGVSALMDTRRRYDQDLANQLRDMRFSFADRAGADRRSGLAAATGALGQLGGLASGTANKIADIFSNTERSDQDAAKALYQMYFGLGGGYGA